MHSIQKIEDHLTKNAKTSVWYDVAKKELHIMVYGSCEVSMTIPVDIQETNPWDYLAKYPEYKKRAIKVLAQKYENHQKYLSKIFD